MLLQGKTVLITGASKGIGKAIAELFSNEGARLILLARDIVELQKVSSILNNNQQHLIYSCDIKDADAIKNVARDLQKQVVEIDVLINNAGVMKDAMLLLAKDVDIYENIAVNLLGTISVTKIFMKGMLKNKSGSIINVSSIIGTNGNAGQSVYSASKSGVIGFTKSLSKELAPLQIRVNAIAPGFIETEMTASISDDIRQKTINNIGMKKAGTGTDVAKVALFLASDLSKYVTGQIIGVDGGMII